MRWTGVEVVSHDMDYPVVGLEVGRVERVMHKCESESPAVLEEQAIFDDPADSVLVADHCLFGKANDFGSGKRIEDELGEHV